jgi:hypothetical protein
MRNAQIHSTKSAELFIIIKKSGGTYSYHWAFNHYVKYCVTKCAGRSQPSRMSHRILSLKQIDVSEVRTASIMETVRTSETSVYLKETTRRFQKTVIFILAAVRT